MTCGRITEADIHELEAEREQERCRTEGHSWQATGRYTDEGERTETWACARCTLPFVLDVASSLRTARRTLDCYFSECNRPPIAKGATYVARLNTAIGLVSDVYTANLHMGCYFSEYGLVALLEKVGVEPSMPVRHGSFADYVRQFSEVAR